MTGSGVRDGLDGRDRTEVLIVGGGVTGLTASLLLSRLGVDHVLVERHEGTALVPKGHIINQRAMEIFRDVGVADDIYAIGCPPEKMSTVSWMTSLAGPTPLHGRRLARTDAWCGGPGYTAASPSGQLTCRSCAWSRCSGGTRNGGRRRRSRSAMSCCRCPTPATRSPP